MHSDLELGMVFKRSYFFIVCFFVVVFANEIG